jgi:hypothetical protein
MTNKGNRKHKNAEASVKLDLKKAGKLVCLFVWVVMLAGAHVWAQDIFGVISGTVTDPTGAVVSDAKIIIQSEDTKQQRVVMTNSSGYYTAPQLSVGRYSITAMRSGFKAYKIVGTDLVAGGHVTVNLPLTVGSTNETVDVSTTTDTINSSTA